MISRYIIVVRLATGYVVVKATEEEGKIAEDGGTAKYSEVVQN